MLNFFDGRKVYMDGNYPAVYIDGKNCHVHRLQWEKYHGDIPNGYVVHHKDENKCNWNIENLELLPRNVHLDRHRYEQRRDHLKGDNALHRKLSQTEVDYIRKVYVKYDKIYGGRALAKMFGVSEGCISAIVHYKNWGGGMTDAELSLTLRCFLNFGALQSSIPLPMRKRLL